MDMCKKEIDETTKAFRAGIQDRAVWFYLLLKASGEQGADPVKVAEKAITQFGKAKGAAFGKVEGADEFIDKLSQGYACGAFEMEKVEHTPQKSVLHFHHCPLVEAWKQLGCSKEEISELSRFLNRGTVGTCKVGRSGLSLTRLLIQFASFFQILIHLKLPFSLVFVKPTNDLTILVCHCCFGL